MQIIDSKYALCTCCMEEHEIKIVKVHETTIFKGKEIDYEATYYYCDIADEFYMDEKQLNSNDIIIKDIYRASQNLLTSQEIISIRNKYQITQKDLSILLGWGTKTITRYESHQVQDKAHDSILKKLSNDPEWFLKLLNDSQDCLSESSYLKYFKVATDFYESNRETYLRKYIHAQYIRYQQETIYTCNSILLLDKVIDVIRYLAASKKVTKLYKVKLMKLLWYIDNLSYRERGHSMTGLVYKALPMGAVPIAHESIISLKDVPCTEVDMGETIAYHFKLDSETNYQNLNTEDINLINIVIDKLGLMSKNEIIDYMHNEKAYSNTKPKDIIEYKYAEFLQI